ncbi:hypothetical protein PGTUg99_034028 [Puccinia graminis f. sp. tritici]|uniref:Uncharacterized protein n=1 Tax=Puccinia graminis f. sp. tritici TaxID=56615 RepID=A0A5B0QUQ0_PUCGR|nr:hypothetical protein PGTUg99_034028 [Puccinia graminis f. sp. tritici]
MTSWAVGVQLHPPVSEGRVRSHAPRTPDSSEDQASEGGAIKPAPQRRAGAMARPFWRGVGVGGRAFINAPEVCTPPQQLRRFSLTVEGIHSQRPMETASAVEVVYTPQRPRGFLSAIFSGR